MVLAADLTAAILRRRMCRDAALQLYRLPAKRSDKCSCTKGYTCVGALVGALVGAVVGALVGAAVGADVGARVGAAVGDPKVRLMPVYRTIHPVKCKSGLRSGRCPIRGFARCGAR